MAHRTHRTRSITDLGHNAGGKGPLVTQTLQDIIDDTPYTGKPLHWRGDRDGIEEFNVTFTDLLGKDAQLSAEEMQGFKGFLATIHFSPNLLVVS